MPLQGRAGLEQGRWGVLSQHPLEMETTHSHPRTKPKSIITSVRQIPTLPSQAYRVPLPPD